jgi:hypothetical protein
MRDSDAESDEEGDEEVVGEGMFKKKGKRYIFDEVHARKALRGMRRKERERLLGVVADCESSAFVMIFLGCISEF